MSYAYNIYRDKLAKALADWTAGGLAVRVLLLSNAATYTPAATHNFVSDVIAGSVAELAVTGYTRKDITSRTVFRDDTTPYVEMRANDNVWASLAGSPGSGGQIQIQSAIVYVQVGGDDTTPGDDFLVAQITAANFPLTCNGSPFTLSYPNGINRLTA